MNGLRAPIELMLFDLGGTLFHEKGPWDELYRRADAELWKVLHGAGAALEPPRIYGTAETLIQYYSKLDSPDLSEPTTFRVLDALLRQEGIALEQEALRAGLRAMYAVTQPNWQADEDVIPTLRRLKHDGLRIGAVSNGADDENTHALVDRSGVRPYLEFTISSAAFGKRKPDPGIFRVALDHFGVPPERAVMVGDNYEADILGAHRTGMQAIWMTRHVGRPLPAATQGEPEAVVPALSAIPPLLQGV